MRLRFFAKTARTTACALACTALLGSSLASAAPAPANADIEALKKELAELKAELGAQREKVDAASAKAVERAVVEVVDQATPASNTELETVKQELAAIKAEMASAAEAQLAKEMEELQAADAEREKPSLKIYGFLDAGLSKAWLSNQNPFGPAYPFKNATFVPGNMNLYFDGRPSPYFRALLETRYSFYPHGDVPTTGTDVKRTDTRLLDTFSTSGYNKVVWGGTIIERAQMDWLPKQEFNLRIGYFLTPYGIWNVDHGTPTLISMLLPQFQVEEAIPQRQTGVQAFGSHSVAPFEVGYNAYISNGRAPFIMRTAPGFGSGGRLYLRHMGTATTTVGTSWYYSTFQQDKLGFKLSPEFSLTSAAVYKGTEWAVGADLSVDYGPLRIRSEGLIRHVKYDEGFHEPTSEFGTSNKPNRYENYGYVIAAYRIGKYFEPYWYQEIKWGRPAYTSAEIANVTSGGLNIYFTAQTMLKLQYVYLNFYNRNEAPDPDNQDLKYFISRFITVF
ncbi:MAG: hypothetical protein SF187_01765 [Deltaproteobacteria bacterium]|nr:hypothetical protein [Deltaproteobacteria bacterium]